MNLYDRTLAKKYAVAFLRVYNTHVTQEYYAALKDMYIFLNKEKEVMHYLQLPILDDAKTRCIDMLAQAYGVLEIRNLFDLLHDAQRVYLLPLIIWWIIRLYERRHAIMRFSIKSSHSLKDDDLNTIRSFLAAMTHASIAYTYEVDSRLIAGIRLQSDELLWENSVSKKLREARHLLAQRNSL